MVPIMCWARLSHFELDHHKINSRGQQDHQVILHHNSQMRLWPAPSYLTTNWLDSLTRTILPTNFNTKKSMFEFELLLFWKDCPQSLIIYNLGSKLKFWQWTWFGFRFVQSLGTISNFCSSHRHQSNVFKSILPFQPL